MTNSSRVTTKHYIGNWRMVLKGYMYIKGIFHLFSFFLGSGAVLCEVLHCFYNSWVESKHYRVASLPALQLRIVSCGWFSKLMVFWLLSTASYTTHKYFTHSSYKISNSKVMARGSNKATLVDCFCNYIQPLIPENIYHFVISLWRCMVNMLLI